MPTPAWPRPTLPRLKIDLDEDDGRLEYELEWRVGGTEYECTVDASSGSILHFEIDD